MSRPRDFEEVLARIPGFTRADPAHASAPCPLPGHLTPDGHLSLRDAGDRCLVKCHGRHEYKEILEYLGFDSLMYESRSRQSKARGDARVVAMYNYTDESGHLQYQSVRYEPKKFSLRRRGEDGRWLNNMDGVRRVPYRLPEVIQAVETGDIIYVVEGEKDADALHAVGLTATTNSEGAGKWRQEYSTYLRDAEVIILADKDEAGRKHAKEVEALSRPYAASVQVLELPDRDGKKVKDVSDWLESGGTAAELGDLVKRGAPDLSAPRSHIGLDEVLDMCRRYLYLPDTGPVEVILAAIAANLLPGDPVWLLLVGPPGYGKTEALNIALTLPCVYEVGVLTEASLLSGTPRREAPGAKGGLLKEMGEFGVLLVKDFGGILSLTRESRGPILAAMREVYDGSWTRYVGSDGGRTLAWQGKAGLIGGATPSIDRHYAVMAALGERFSYYRMPDTNEACRAAAALAHTGREQEMRKGLAETTRQFVAGLDLGARYPTVSKEELNRLISLAHFATRCRSAVERDAYQNREIQLIPGSESPTRFVKVLRQILDGMHVIGIEPTRAWTLLTKIALDSMPALRQRVILALLEQEEDRPVVCGELATSLGYPTNTTRRTLEDLACHGVVVRESQSQGLSDLWQATPWARTVYADAIGPSPETPGQGDTTLESTDNTEDSISGTPPRSGGALAAPAIPRLRCPSCGSTDFWQRQDGGHVCSVCHPRPPQRLSPT